MVKFGKSKLKTLNKLAKKQNASTNNASNKVLKKKLNVEKKVTFQKEVLLKETAKSETLVKKVSKTDIALRNLFKKPEKPKENSSETEVKKPKIKAVEKKKKRQKTQIGDTKLLLNLMKKKS